METKTSEKAVVSLVFGILGWLIPAGLIMVCTDQIKGFLISIFVTLVFYPLAIILGVKALKSIKVNEKQLKGEAIATIGLIMGIVGFIILLICIILGIISFWIIKDIDFLF